MDYILVISLLFFSAHGLSFKDTPYLKLTLEGFNSTQTSIRASWNINEYISGLRLSWYAVLLDQQEISYEYIDQILIESYVDFEIISKGIESRAQFRVCINDEQMRLVCSFITLPDLNDKNGLYMVSTSSHGDSIILTWNFLSGISVSVTTVKWKENAKTHPGYSKKTTSNTFAIEGLIPSTRYEICVETKPFEKAIKICDHYTTAAAGIVPGNPLIVISICYVTKLDESWVCDVTWKEPIDVQGKILGYKIIWKDTDGIVVQEELSAKMNCNILCTESTTMSLIHPHEVCLVGRNLAGFGNESCIRVSDVPGKVTAFYELRVVVIVLMSMVIIRLSIPMIKLILLYCYRKLTRSDSEKKHPV